MSPSVKFSLPCENPEVYKVSKLKWGTMQILVGALSKLVEINWLKVTLFPPTCFPSINPIKLKPHTLGDGPSPPPILETSKHNLKIPSVHVYSCALP